MVYLITEDVFVHYGGGLVVRFASRSKEKAEKALKALQEATDNTFKFVELPLGDQYCELYSWAE